MAVRRPVSSHCRIPHLSIGLGVNPAAVVVEIFRAGDRAADVFVAFRIFELVVAPLVPAVPIVAAHGALFAKVDIARRVAAYNQHAPFPQSLDAFIRGHFGFAVANGHDRISALDHLNAILAVLHRPDGH
jgi:hypothetical protein